MTKFWRSLLRRADPGLRMDGLSDREIIQEGKTLALYAVKELARRLGWAQAIADMGLSPRDAALYQSLLEVISDHGHFSGLEAHYTPRSPDPTLTCQGCAFWAGSGAGCLITGATTPEGLCRYHLTPHFTKQDAEPIKYVQDWHGLQLGITHEPGDLRHGRPMRAKYGHVRGTYGQAADGMAIDVYVNPEGDRASVFRITQLNPDTRALDEYKYMLGYGSDIEAEAAYLAHMPAKFFGGVRPCRKTEISPIRGDGEPTRRLIRFQGLTIGVTHEPGDRRFALSAPMRCCYGRLHRSYGAARDGKALDVYLPADFDGSGNIYRIAQRDPATGELDEHKLMIGYPSAAAAKAEYVWHAGPNRFGMIEAVDPAELDRYRADSLWHADTCGCEACARQPRRSTLAPSAAEDDDDPERGSRLVRDGWLGDRLRTDSTPDADVQIGTWLRDRAIAGTAPILRRWQATLQRWLQSQGSYETALRTLAIDPKAVLNLLDPRAFERILYQHMMLGTLAGWEIAGDESCTDGLALRQDAQPPNWMKLPFQEAIAYFRKKTAIPVETYRQLTADYHDWAFSIARTTRADILEAAQWLLTKALEDGYGFDQFEDMWTRLIGRRGWKPQNPRHVWTIFDTNIRGAIGAGRYQQLTEPAMLARRPIWVWIWRDSPNPRPAHKALHRKGIRADHPFWRGLRVPAGFGCRCTFFAMSEEQAERLGIEILDNPPDPKQIADPGFRVPFEAIAPYGSRDRDSFLRDKLKGYSGPIRKVLSRELESA